jgi:leucyl/phenylalanyl-tRNA---protein transferase
MVPTPWPLAPTHLCRKPSTSSNMASRDDIVVDITPQVLLKAYACGIFPMAESEDDPALYWIEPQARGILPLDQLHIAKRLQRTIKQDLFEVRVDSNFDAIIDGCGSMRAGRDTTWINAKIRKLYGDLYDLGHCHTVEVWRDGELAGGLYGVALEGAFFGESMFSYQTDASKVALVHLLARLIAGKFTLLDCQFVTEHLRQFGTVEIDRASFHKKLDRALKRPADFLALPKATSGAAALQIIAAGQLCPTKRL